MEASEDVPVTLDRKAIFGLKAAQREKWLKRALKQAAENQIRASDLYDVIASTRFADDIPYKLGQKMARAIRQQLSLFSGKQQRFLSADAALVKKFGQDEEPEETAEAAKEKEAAQAAETTTQMEEMMARCRAFVREKMQERGERANQGEAEPAEPQQEPNGSAATLPTSMPSAAAGLEGQAPPSEAAPPSDDAVALATAGAGRAADASGAKGQDAGKAERSPSRKRRKASSSSASSSRRAKRRAKESGRKGSSPAKGKRHSSSSSSPPRRHRSSSSDSTAKARAKKRQQARKRHRSSSSDRSGGRKRKDPK